VKRQYWDPQREVGETPLAAVILHQSDAVTAEGLCEWINERVDAKNQRVCAVTIVEDFPAVVREKR